MLGVRSKNEIYAKGRSIVLADQQTLAYIHVCDQFDFDASPLESVSHLIFCDLLTGKIKATLPAQTMWLNLLSLPNGKLFIESNVKYCPSVLLEPAKIEKVVPVKRSQLSHPMVYQNKLVYAANNAHPELHFSELNKLTEEAKSDYFTACIPRLEKDKKYGINHIAVSDEKNQIAVAFAHEVHLLQQANSNEEDKFELSCVKKVEFDSKFEDPITKLVATPIGFISINQGNERTTTTRQKVDGNSAYKILCRIGWFVGLGPEAKEEEITDITFNILDHHHESGIKKSWTPSVGINVASELLALPHGDGIILSYVKNSEQIILWNMTTKTREVIDTGTPVMGVFVEENSQYFGIIHSGEKPLLFDLIRMKMTDLAELQQYRKKLKTEINKFFCNDTTSLLTSYLWNDKKIKKVSNQEVENQEYTQDTPSALNL